MAELKCSECQLELSASEGVACDSCSRFFHKKPCSGLNASEIKVMELKGNILWDLQERQKRANNNMLFNVPGGNDLEETRKVLQILLEHPPNMVKVSRMGKLNKNKSQDSKVILDSTGEVENLVRNVYKLKKVRYLSILT